MKAKDLIPGTLYHVSHWESGWIIAKFIGHHDAFKAHGIRSDGKTTWTEPAGTRWEYVNGGTFEIKDKNLQVRTLTQETMQTIAQLKSDCERTKEAYYAALAALREFCS